MNSLRLLPYLDRQVPMAASIRSAIFMPTAFRDGFIIFLADKSTRAPESNAERPYSVVFEDSVVYSDVRPTNPASPGRGFALDIHSLAFHADRPSKESRWGPASQSASSHEDHSPHFIHRLGSANGGIVLGFLFFSSLHLFRRIRRFQATREPTYCGIVPQPLQPPPPLIRAIRATPTAPSVDDIRSLPTAQHSFSGTPRRRREPTHQQHQLHRQGCLSLVRLSPPPLSWRRR